MAGPVLPCQPEGSPPKSGLRFDGSTKVAAAASLVSVCHGNSSLQSPYSMHSSKLCLTPFSVAETYEKQLLFFWCTNMLPGAGDRQQQCYSEQHYSDVFFLGS